MQMMFLLDGVFNFNMINYIKVRFLTMKKVLFICHGNICRSVSAEYIMKDLAKKNGVELYVSSAATSREEIGNDIYPPAKRKLKEKRIPSMSLS